MRKIIVLVCLGIGIMIILKVYRYEYSGQGHIYNYNFIRDKGEILNIINDNYKYLFEGTDACPEYILQKMRPSEGTQYIGRLKIKVVRDNNKLAGFISYYKEDTQKGMIQLLAVEYNSRGKGYGTKLMQCALNDLFLDGVKCVGVWVLVDNHIAQRMYKKVGFVGKCIEENDLYLEYYP
jgi:ribosomal protein S18 acetylase RimI-like enzyme